MSIESGAPVASETLAVPLPCTLNTTKRSLKAFSSACLMPDRYLATFCASFICSIQIVPDWLESEASGCGSGDGGSGFGGGFSSAAPINQEEEW